MTSKTFKSAWPNHPRRINVREIEDGVNVRISDPQWDDKKGITLAPSDAPALALAILEAAGHEGDAKKVGIGTIEGQFASAVFHLRRGLVRQERVTAEAKERAELESEAFNLYRTYIAVHEPMNTIGDWHMLAERTKEHWLAVARRAREINKEEK